MKNNKQFKLMTFREKQHKMYKIVITMIIAILAFELLCTLFSVITNTIDIKELNAEDVYSMLDYIEIGTSSFTILKSILGFITNIIISSISLILLSISRIIQTGIENNTKNTICKIINTILILVLILIIITKFDINIKFLSICYNINFILSLIVVIIEFIGILVYLIQAIMIFRFTFCKIKIKEKNNEN